MALTSYGYDGTLFEGPWGIMWPYMGKGPVVQNDAAQKVTAVSGQSKVRVAVGAGAAAGVYVDNTTAVDITLATASGSAKYWTIVRRTSGTGASGVSSFVALGPGTANALAGTMVQNPGVQFDSPLAIVRCDVGVTTPVIVSDQRITLEMADWGWGPWIDIGHSSAVIDSPANGHTWAYRLSVPPGRVEIRGAIAALDGAFSGGLTSQSSIGSPLPGGTIGNARPNRTQWHVQAANYDAATKIYTARYSIDDTGQITYFNPTGPQWLSFDGWVYDLT
jgi:hypothetical protein